MSTYIALMEREDLGMLFGRVTRRLMDAERPLLERHGLSMWGYVALSQLARGAADTQLSLAHAMGYDKTRLIGVLDDLEAEGLVTRQPDAEDRRRRIVALTEAGTRRWALAHEDIRAMEKELLGDLGPAEVGTLLTALERLAL